jgi:hypothetical protein
MFSDKGSQLTTLWALLIALGIVTFGIVLLFVAASVPFFVTHGGCQSVLRSIGSLAIASVGISFLFQVLGKRAFLREILDQVRLGEDLRRAAIVGCGMDYLGDINWEEMFRGATELDICFVYGHSWRQHNLLRLRTLARRKGATVRVIMPNPDNSAVVSSLASVFGTQSEDVRNNIWGAKKQLDEIFGSAEAITYDVWYLNQHPEYTYYRVGHAAVVLFHTAKNPYDPPPVLKIDSAGTFYKFFAEEFRFFLEGSRDGKYPPPTTKAAPGNSGKSPAVPELSQAATKSQSL